MQDISQEILIQAATGDIGSFERIYKATSSFVYTVALRITRNRDDAEDVTQEVFLKIHKNLNNFQFRSTFKTWVYRITVNSAINAAKKTTQDLSRRADFDKTIASQGVEMKPESLEKQDNQALIKSLLDKLNPEQRACILLREIENLSYAEIAQALKININTVRSRLKRARETLLTIKPKKR